MKRKSLIIVFSFFSCYDVQYTLGTVYKKKRVKQNSTFPDRFPILIKKDHFNVEKQ